MGVSAKDCRGKAVWYDSASDTYSSVKQNDSDVNFDSEFEFGVWKVLKRSISKLFLLERQYKLFLNPETKYFRAGSWRVDFALLNADPNDCSHGSPVVLVEAKGTITDEFKQMLKLLDVCNPEALDRLIIVTPSKEKLGNLKITTPKELPRILEKMS